MEGGNIGAMHKSKQFLLSTFFILVEVLWVMAMGFMQPLTKMHQLYVF